MPFSDFTVGVMDNEGGFGLVGGNEALAVRHDSLSSPLTLQGTYCRLLMASGTNTQEKKYQWTFDNTQQPNFSQITDDKAVEMTLWVRRIGGANNCTVGLGFKTGEVVGNQSPRGYLLSVGEGPNFATTDENALHLRSIDGGGSIRYDSGDVVVIPEDTWVQLKMEVRPIRQGSVFVGDEVKVYRNTNEATPSWELLVTQRFYRFVDRGFMPWWGDVDYDTTQFPSAGFHIYTVGGDSTDRNENNGIHNKRAYVSTFTMKVETAFP